MLSTSLIAFLMASVSIGPHCIHSSHKFSLPTLRLVLRRRVGASSKYNCYSCPHMPCLQYFREASVLVEPSLNPWANNREPGRRTKPYLAPALCIVFLL